MVLPGVHGEGAAVEPWYADGPVTVFAGDCLDVMAAMEEASIDAVVTDPPAGVSFMGREWDSDRGSRDRWVGWLAERMVQAFRVLKPGGHALVWSLPRTSHWTALALEDAGFEVRDCILHVFGSGFPKSLDVGKAIDRSAGAEREVIGPAPYSRGRARQSYSETRRVSYDYDPQPLTAPATENAARWNGWGTALKPSQEMWWLCRKPLAAGTVAGNVLEWGTGALNINGCRVEGPAGSGHWIRNGEMGTKGIFGSGGQPGGDFGSQNPNTAGRWPPNLLLSHSPSCQPAGTRRVRGSGDRGTSVKSRGGILNVTAERRPTEGTGYADADGLETVEAWDCTEGCPVAEMDRQSGSLATCGGPKQVDSGDSSMFGLGQPGRIYPDSGGASRFFPVFRYQAKAPASERPKLPDGTAWPTVKPLGLMRWLVRLVTPPDGTVCDPFGGTGATAEACAAEGFNCILIERDPVALELIRTRLGKPVPAGQDSLF